MTPERTYATLFDGAYAVKGWLMATSMLGRASRPSELNVLALDARAYEVGLRLVQWAQSRGHAVHVVSLDDLVTVEPSVSLIYTERTWQHFCWSMGSIWTKWTARQTMRLPICYLDADLWFFADPEIAWREAYGCSVAVVPHRFPPQYADRITNGKRNVCWVSFHDFDGINLLIDWAARCAAQCDAATCGDQRYLDAWDVQLAVGKLHDFASKGIIPGPWNAWSYHLSRTEDEVRVNGEVLVAYHFHEFMRTPDGFRRSRGYPMTPELAALVYEPYERAYLEAEAALA